jgi:hypothetical protein
MRASIEPEGHRTEETKWKGMISWGTAHCRIGFQPVSLQSYELESRRPMDYQLTWLAIH